MDEARMALMEKDAILETLGRSDSPVDMKSGRKSVINLKDAAQLLLEKRLDYQHRNQQAPASPKLTRMSVVRPSSYLAHLDGDSAWVAEDGLNGLPSPALSGICGESSIAPLAAVTSRRNSPVDNVVIATASCTPESQLLSANNSPAYGLSKTTLRNLEKSGFLWKQSESFKSWNKRYFVLQNGTLFYFKSPQDAERKNAEPLGWIPLRRMFGVVECTSSGSPFDHWVKKEGMMRVELPDRVWYLCAESKEEADSWVELLQAILREKQKPTATMSVNGYTDNVLARGWLEKHVRGLIKRRWFVLNHHTLYCFKDEKDDKPSSMTPLDRETCVVELLNPEEETDSEAEDATSDSASLKGLFKVALEKKRKESTRFCVHTPRQSIWFKCDNSADFEKWVSAFVAVCSLAITNQSIIQRYIRDLVEDVVVYRGDLEVNFETTLALLDEYLMKPGLHFSNIPIEHPMTTLPTERLRKDAIQLNKAILLFTTTLMNQQAIDYHLTLAQAIVQTCLPNSELHSEVILQLITQTIYHPYPNSAFTLQTWQLLILCLGIFVPVRDVYYFVSMVLRWHLARGDEDVKLLAEYALKLVHSWNRMSEDGQIVRGRTCPPSRIEVMSIIAERIPKELFVTIQCPGGATLQIACHSSTLARDVCHYVLQKLGIDETGWFTYDQFALYVQTPESAPRTRNGPMGDVKILWPDEFVADALWRHEEHQMTRKGVQRKQVAEFVLELKIWWMYPPSYLGQRFGRLNMESSDDLESSSFMLETIDLRPPKKWFASPDTSPLKDFPELYDFLQTIELPEKLLLFHQIHECIARGWYPYTDSVGIQLAALQAQAVFGDHYPLIELQSDSPYCHDATSQSNLVTAYDLYVPFWLRASERRDLTPTAVIGKKEVTRLVSDFTTGDIKEAKLRAKLEFLSRTGVLESNILDASLGGTKKKLLVERTKKLRDTKERSNPALVQLSKVWSQLRGYTKEDCVNIYLAHVLMWRVCTSRMWLVNMITPSRQPILVAVTFNALCLLNFDLSVVDRVPYERLVSHRLVKDDEVALMVDLSQTSGEDHKLKLTGTEIWRFRGPNMREIRKVLSVAIDGYAESLKC